MNKIFESFNKFVEEVDPDSIDLSSFKVKDDLNREIWDENDQLRPEIRQKLLKIAQDFFNELDLPPHVKMKDLTFTGSLANYNWSQFSDVDLHILVNFAEIDENTDLVKKYLDFRRMNWNKIHDILVKDYEVEIYVQDDSEPHHSTGVYSILNDEWITKPSKERPQTNWSAVQEKAAYLMDEIDELAPLVKGGEFQRAREVADKIKHKIKCMRKCGLESGGEFSVENIAFKTLRRNGYIEKLNNYKDNAYDKMMSVRES